MSLRHWFLSLVAGGALLSAAPAHAQYLPLPVLERGLATNTLDADSVARLLPASEWLFHPGDDPYWTCRKTGKRPRPNQPPPARVELRHTNRHPYYDLVYKTSRRRAIARLRTGLRRQISLQAEPITCVQCEGERLVGYEYTITLINQRASYAAKRVAFPYVLVMRRTTGSLPDDGDTTEALTQILR